MVSFGDSISIDTEQVAYIEYKAYHTYTFRIIRNEAEENAPVENLILSLEPDGTYKELIKTYYLSPEDIENISIGNGFDPSGKSQTIEIAKGTFLSKTSCRYESQTVWQDCRSTQHNRNNITDWHKCEYSGNDAPRVYTIEVFICEEDSPAPGGWDPAEFPVISYGGGSPLSGHSNPNPNPNPGPDPSAVEEAQNELGGIITLPNILPNPKNNTPCLKIKANFEDDRFKEKVAAIDKPSVFNMDHEMGYAVGYPINTSLTEIQYPPMENKVGTHSVTLPSGSQYFGFIHSHTDDNGDIIRARIFSNADVATFLTSCVRNAQQHGDISDAYAMVITSEGNYMLKYTGTGNFNIGPGQLKNWSNWYNKKFRELVENDELTQTNLEKMFMRFLNESVNIPGLEIYHIEKNTGKASKMNNDATKKPCP